MKLDGRVRSKFYIFLMRDNLNREFILDPILLTCLGGKLVNSIGTVPN
jgi:hypothetical protein